MNVLNLILVAIFSFIGAYGASMLAIKIELHNAKVRDEWKARRDYLSSLNTRP